MTKDNANNPLLENNRNKDQQVNCVFGCTSFILIVMLGACLITFYMTCTEYDLSHKDSDAKWVALRDSLYAQDPTVESQPTDTVLCGDSLLRKEAGDKLINSQRIIISRQDKLADDLRQETNNLINKMNGWLAFWLAVMAILGVFIPIALQFKLYRETRDEDIRRKEDFDKKVEQSGKEFKQWKKEIDNWENQLLELKNQLSMDIRSEQLKIEAEINQSFLKQKDELGRISYAIKVRTFHNLAECNGIRTMSNRKDLLETNWREILKSVDKFIRHYLTEPGDSDRGYNLSIVLVQLIDVLDAIRRLAPRRQRAVALMVTRTSRLIELINNPVAITPVSSAGTPASEPSTPGVSSIQGQSLRHTLSTYRDDLYSIRIIVSN